MVNQSLTIHALRPSFAIIGSAFAMIRLLALAVSFGLPNQPFLVGEI